MSGGIGRVAICDRVGVGNVGTGTGVGWLAGESPEEPDGIG